MAIYRVHKTDNYTVMSNYHLRDKNLSLKAKGLLSLMLSLPDEWDYTEMGLATLSKDGRAGVRNALKELEQLGYLVRYQSRENGAFSNCIYDVYEHPPLVIPELKINRFIASTTSTTPLSENPTTEKPISENPSTGKPISENRTQINTNKSNTNKSITNVSNKEKKHKYGEFKNVLLTDEEVEKLKAKLPDWEKWIETLSQGIELKGYKYKSHYLAILKWAKSEEKQTTNREYKEFWE